jgi:hypothetical protein
MAQADWLCRRNVAMDARGRDLANVQGTILRGLNSIGLDWIVLYPACTLFRWPCQ